MTAPDTAAQVLAAAERIRALGDSAPRAGRDPVNQPMINNWTEAIGDVNPLYSDAEFAAQSAFGGPVAPPAMAQVWTMNGLHGTRTDDDPLGLITAALDDAGYTSVVATNSNQTYHRHIRVGEEVTASSRLEDVVGPKTTALGVGWFFTTRTLWRVGDEVVAEMVFRLLKFRPQAADVPETPTVPAEGPSGRIVDASAYAGGVLRPVISRDTAFYWEGAQVGELRIQGWGETLRHPPGPMDPNGDLGAVPDYVVSPGAGTVFSFVVHHHPKVPGKRLPFVVALVELDEGVRVLGELIDADPAEVHIGQRVQAVFLRVDDDLTLPAWEVA
jgi:hypothetical protein